MPPTYYEMRIRVAVYDPGRVIAAAAYAAVDAAAYAAAAAAAANANANAAAAAAANANAAAAAFATERAWQVERLFEILGPEGEPRP